MMEKEILTEKLRKVRKEEEKPKVVFMPHFCIDLSVRYEGKKEAFLKDAEKIIEQGGGNIPTKNMLLRGGKAANCASAVSSLGAEAYLIAKTNNIGYEFLKNFSENDNFKISHVKRNGELASTSAIELKEGNIMFSDQGSTEGFSVKDITDDDKKLIADADVVCISDWALNKKGTELARYVLELVKKNGKGKTFFDPGDPSFRKDIRDVTKILDDGLVDMVSVNEDEFEKYLSSKPVKDVEICLHTENFSCTFWKDRKYVVETFDVNVKKHTGAGDAWGGGYIYGKAIGLKERERIMLANAVAACYISNEEGKHPTKDELIDFLKKAKFKQVTV
ncbi:MAG: hypothetical protein A7316_06455 [Candidatus Altiarchaeales archaeon WOR_SM1_86-2]|nr:MAG: hypothetical protein A7316_06455 [Candidatus Altiarchaeales archaeon WOR_SM1_86-2]ODS39622.1 MAG: hypothetical protein A7315_10775 [Candidatus Altiarchaeales archaeon WOR_SM1_79]